MLASIFQKLALPLAAAGIAAITGASHDATAGPAAYGAERRSLDVNTVLEDANLLFSRADLNNDGFVDPDEYAIFAIVNAEISALNGFVTFDRGTRAPVVKIEADDTAPTDRKVIIETALSEYGAMSSTNRKLTRDEFAQARLEKFVACDIDRDGVLTGNELDRFALNAAGVRVSVS